MRNAHRVEDSRLPIVTKPKPISGCSGGLPCPCIWDSPLCHRICPNRKAGIKESPFYFQSRLQHRTSCLLQIAAVRPPGRVHPVFIPGCSSGAVWSSTSCIYSRLQQGGVFGPGHRVSIPGCSGGAPWHRATADDGEDHGLINYICSLLACLPAVHGAMTFSELRAPLAS